MAALAMLFEGLMTNPYQTPPIVIEPRHARGGLWRRAVGMLSMPVAPLIVLDGGLIVLMVVLAGSGYPNPRFGP